MSIILFMSEISDPVSEGIRCTDKWNMLKAFLFCSRLWHEFLNSKKDSLLV